MNGNERSDALARLRPLAEDTGHLIAKAIAPIDDAIRQIGVSFRASHFAEDCRDWNPEGYGIHQAHASRFVFAIEATDGNVSEYCLCAARGPDGRHGLYVSVCEYRVVSEQRENEDGGAGVVHRAVIDRIYLVKPNALSLALRAQILDELSQGHFLKAYEEHVRQNLPDGAVFRYWLPQRSS
jgi:hypothetical protein